VKLLLDTHAFLWFIAGNTALSRKCRTLIEDDDNQKFVSIASITEIAIKTSLGKLSLKHPFDEIIPQQLRRNNFYLHPFTIEHAILLSKLPFHHRDPFDRMIVAQSLVENLPVLSNDGALDAYGIKRIW
jgi:PIN domain nuclease of toxin-antitoxin system